MDSNVGKTKKKPCSHWYSALERLPLSTSKMVKKLRGSTEESGLAPPGKEETTENSNSNQELLKGE